MNPSASPWNEERSRMVSSHTNHTNQTMPRFCRRRASFHSYGARDLCNITEGVSSERPSNGYENELEQAKPLPETSELGYEQMDRATVNNATNAAPILRQHMKYQGRRASICSSLPCTINERSTSPMIPASSGGQHASYINHQDSQNNLNRCRRRRSSICSSSSFNRYHTRQASICSSLSGTIVEQNTEIQPPADLGYQYVDRCQRRRASMCSSLSGSMNRYQRRRASICSSLSGSIYENTKLVGETEEVSKRCVHDDEKQRHGENQRISKDDSISMSVARDSESTWKRDSVSRGAPSSLGVQRAAALYIHGSQELDNTQRRRASLRSIPSPDYSRRKKRWKERQDTSCPKRAHSSNFDDGETIPSATGSNNESVEHTNIDTESHWDQKQLRTSGRRHSISDEQPESNISPYRSPKFSRYQRRRPFTRSIPTDKTTGIPTEIIIYKFETPSNSELGYGITETDNESHNRKEMHDAISTPFLGLEQGSAIDLNESHAGGHSVTRCRSIDLNVPVRRDSICDDREKFESTRPVRRG